MRRAPRQPVPVQLLIPFAQSQADLIAKALDVNY